MSRTIIIGGGIIGLSIAYALSKRESLRSPGNQITVLEKDRIGRQASWAGVGILPPSNRNTAIHPLEHLEAFSMDLHRQWSSELKTITGVDNELRRCGGIYLARTAGEKASLIGQQLQWDDRQIEYENLSRERIRQLLSTLPDSESISGFLLPDEFKLRNPFHLQALQAACLLQGVEIRENVGPVQLRYEASQIQCVSTGQAELEADHYCVAAGPWSESVVQSLGQPLPSTPVRGQIALFKFDQPLFQPIVNEGTRYLVPRDDGHILVGSTIEEVGFDTSVEATDIDALKTWARSLLPEFTERHFVQSWAGLRPGTYDGFPYLGPLGDIANAWIASGHFKAGLHLSTGTAEIMADLIEGKTPPIDITPFLPERVFETNTE